jgi:signal-transduction protein with cAMP-binding, CBS, and nucleotidyltransferase domain
MSIKNNYILSFLFCFILSLSWGQDKNDWTILSESNRVEINNISFDQEKNAYKVQAFSMGIESVKQTKECASRNFWNISNVINVPNADGSIEEYRVLDAQILHPDLAKQYQTLKVMLVLQYCIPENIYGSVYLKRDFMDRFFEAGNQLTL